MDYNPDDDFLDEFELKEFLQHPKMANLDRLEKWNKELDNFQNEDFEFCDDLPVQKMNDSREGDFEGFFD